MINSRPLPEDFHDWVLILNWLGYSWGKLEGPEGKGHEGNKKKKANFLTWVFEEMRKNKKSVSS